MERLGVDVLSTICRYLTRMDMYALTLTCTQISKNIERLCKPFCVEDALISLARLEMAWTIPNFIRLRCTYLMALGITKGDLSLLEWLRVHGCHFVSEDMFKAVHLGQKHVVRWMCGPNSFMGWCETNSRLLPSSCMLYATRQGDLATLQWLVEEHGCTPSTRCGERLCITAAVNGHLAILQWAYVQGFPMPKDKCAQLAQDYGHLSIVHWLTRIRG